MVFVNVVSTRHAGEVILLVVASDQSVAIDPIEVGQHRRVVLWALGRLWRTLCLDILVLNEIGAELWLRLIWRQCPYLAGALKIARCQSHLTLWQNPCIGRVKARIDQLDIVRGRIGLRGIVKGGLPWGPTGRRDRHGLTLCYGSDRVKV